ncbi:hypothetical protein N9428_04330 [Flavobacteriaceae bacterium]|nr:hypothetical protein [Flavobacteriaceae bacterium]
MDRCTSRSLGNKRQYLRYVYGFTVIYDRSSVPVGIHEHNKERLWLLKPTVLHGWGVID